MRKAAAKAAKNAYAPYSRFPVGATVLTSHGEIFAGCNVENASYGLTICAERNAVFQAVAAGKPQIRAIVVVTSSDIPSSPCGACRQVLSEFGRDIEVISFSDRGKVLRAQVSDLLPKPFGHEDLATSSRSKGKAR